MPILPKNPILPEGNEINIPKDIDGAFTKLGIRALGTEVKADTLNVNFTQDTEAVGILFGASEEKKDVIDGINRLGKGTEKYQIFISIITELEKCTSLSDEEKRDTILSTIDFLNAPKPKATQIVGIVGSVGNDQKRFSLQELFLEIGDGKKHPTIAKEAPELFEHFKTFAVALKAKRQMVSG